MLKELDSTRMKALPSHTLAPHKKHHRPVHRWLAKWSRWLHIYLSMGSLAAIFFFSVTGFTLNHPDWFFRESMREEEGKIQNELLHLNQPPPENWDESDFGHQIDKLAVAEHLRAQHRLHGHVSDFLSFEDECEVTFQGPGYSATARIDRKSGQYNVQITSNDLISVMNDLHKGRHTGPIWSIVIDVSAIVSTLVALSGFVLIFYLRLNRKRRIFVAALGTAAIAAFTILVMS